MDNNILNNAISEINSKYKRYNQNYSWYKTESENKLLLQKILDSVCDEKMIWLPEYDEIAKYMTGTNGKGLYLVGNCGRGKSIILTKVLPILFQLQKKVFKVYHSDFLINEDAKQNQKIYKLVAKKAFPAVDEIGTEIKDFSVMPIPYILNNCEINSKPFFATGNFYQEVFTKLYGERSFSRLVKASKIIIFRGDDLRIENNKKK